MKTPPAPFKAFGVRSFKRFANGVERMVTREGDVWRKRPLDGEFITLPDGAKLQLWQWDHLGVVAVPKYHRTAHKSVVALQRELAQALAERDEARAALVALQDGGVVV